MTKIISIQSAHNSSPLRVTGVRDRRFTIRYPCAADAQIIELESGKHVDGVTSDISFGGCFVCTSAALPLNSRGRLKLFRKDQVLEALVVVRIVKPRVGLGIEFFDLDALNNEILSRWIEDLRRTR